MFEREESERLAPFACKSSESRGRVIAEPEHAYRTVFGRDRDRVIHSAAFRRLEYKTQVFVYHEGDHYRNRLTHTLEGSQIARTIARALRLNEELAEAVVLAHDLGHTPFGHAGERVLADLMSDRGGFDHNRQSLRVVDLLEERYAAFRGLNLSYETREGILKHGCNWPHPVDVPELLAQPNLESQVADYADEIAYTVHDLDDGLRSGLIEIDDLEPLELWQQTFFDVREQLRGASARVQLAQTIRALIDRLVTELIDESAARLVRSGVGSVDEVRRTDQPLIGFGEHLDSQRAKLRSFLYQNLYEHPRVASASDRAAQTIRDLFAHFRDNPERLPQHVQLRFASDGEERAVSDYVAGMTDRYALDQHQKLSAGGSVSNARQGTGDA
ncbi:MAG: deoxyguanosinetriphosphate triphosphohydrolase [Myxococcota bacterium]